MKKNKKHKMPYILVLQLWIFEHQGKTVEVILNKRTS